VITIRGGRLWCCAGTLAFVALAAAARAEPPVIPVWPGPAPGSEDWTQSEVEYQNPQREKMVRNVVRPTLTVFRPSPASSTGTGVIVCPGGGFRFLSWQTEGTDVAEWLAARGTAAFVLRYRVVDTGSTEEELQRKVAELFEIIGREGPRAAAATASIGALACEDGRRAMKVLREQASRFGLAPDRIGIMGFSAGAAVTIGVGLKHDAESRPSFIAAVYGLSLEDAPVPGDAPPMFLVATSDDPLVAAAESTRLHSQWTAAGHPAELHVYAKGGHGFGMRKQGLPVDGWIERLGEWLEAQGLLSAAR